MFLKAVSCINYSHYLDLTLWNNSYVLMIHQVRMHLQQTSGSSHQQTNRTMGSWYSWFKEIMGASTARNISGIRGGPVSKRFQFWVRNTAILDGKQPISHNISDFPAMVLMYHRNIKSDTLVYLHLPWTLYQFKPQVSHVNMPSHLERRQWHLQETRSHPNWWRLCRCLNTQSRREGHWTLHRGWVGLKNLENLSLQHR